MPDMDHFQKTLADLKAERVRLDALIAGLEAKITGQPITSVPDVGPSDGRSSAAIHPDSFFGMSIIDAAKKFLKMAGRAQPSAAIAAALEHGGMKRPTDAVLSGILIRAAKGREIIKVGRGTWGLSEWYPKPPKEPIADRKKRPAKKAKKPDEKKVDAQKPGKATVAKPAAPRASSGGRPSDAALQVLREAGSPMHAEGITRKVKAQGFSVSRATIESTLNRQAKAGRIQKVGPSMFAAASLAALPAAS